MIYNEDLRLFSYWNVQLNVFFCLFFPSLGIFHFILHINSFQTTKHGKHRCSAIPCSPIADSLVPRLYLGVCAAGPCLRKVKEAGQ